MSSTILNVVNEKVYITIKLEEDSVGLPGMSPMLELRRLSDGNYFDWTPGATSFWKTSGGTQTIAMLHKTWRPGLYVRSWDQSLYNPDAVETYVACVTNSVSGYEIESEELHSFQYSYQKSATAILEAPIYSSVHVEGSLAAVIAHTKGLANGEHFLDQTSYTVYEKQPLLLSGRMRIYSNSLSVGTDNDVIATFRITSTWTNNQLQTYKVESE